MKKGERKSKDNNKIEVDKNLTFKSWFGLWKLYYWGLYFLVAVLAFGLLSWIRKGDFVPGIIEGAIIFVAGTYGGYLVHKYILKRKLSDLKKSGLLEMN
tara:strand:+ start:286 stop:582 length:297 start_codon:yes stop_codon:yes gene_type:complete